MEDKDDLKEILGGIHHITTPIDLESVILKSIEEQEMVNRKIARYKANGFKALVLSVILLLILVVLFSVPRETEPLEYVSSMYVFSTLALLVLFVQLETGGMKLINNIKNIVS